ncbi:MAG: hypothetical protein IPK33_05880 [Gemmatimonadetes bacterium]|nr:hypothetical protein [Gemmatimonadota bacterium]
MYWWWLGLALGAGDTVGAGWLAAGESGSLRGAPSAGRVVGTLERVVATARFARAFGTLPHGGEWDPRLACVARGCNNVALSTLAGCEQKQSVGGEPLVVSLEGCLLALPSFWPSARAVPRFRWRASVADTFDAESQRTPQGCWSLWSNRSYRGSRALVGLRGAGDAAGDLLINSSALTIRMRRTPSKP